MLIPSASGKKRSEYRALPTTMSGTMESKIPSSAGATQCSALPVFFALMTYKTVCQCRKIMVKRNQSRLGKGAYVSVFAVILIYQDKISKLKTVLLDVVPLKMNSNTDQVRIGTSVKQLRSQMVGLLFVRRSSPVFSSTYILLLLLGQNLLKMWKCEML